MLYTIHISVIIIKFYWSTLLLCAFMEFVSPSCGKDAAEHTKMPLWSTKADFLSPFQEKFVDSRLLPTSDKRIFLEF